ncbi:hypothetical protein TRIATDRAFT_316835 [Trichoderma atroviride IMI 206040]|uniref:Uncharacterized protein n=1 Tax=Hypocrea atroviridis (strain ATCC 20476 / IMI 206040) TaxID=452589 RepID=G9NP74_HYPAI|nr:uncharacterized protein TRIATDRAFT_316835 [Trichoderma atroviride IMI 206040]EHK47859.1 hypothetical protein TRIATDRAFT_316835 [Trichoderma atroviride IMI 206040]
MSGISDETASVVDSQDGFSFNLQLNAVNENRGFHRKNYRGQIQRSNVIDDICQGMLLMGRIDRIIHGRETEDGSPATLVIFGFRFHGADEKRRFKQATITITFRDAKERDDSDPEVVNMWPNGDFTLGHPTRVDVVDSDGTQAGLAVSGNSILQVSGNAAKNWEQQRSYTRETRSLLTGSIMLDMGIRKYGENNAVRITVTEDPLSSSGLTTDFRTAVLLKRKREDDKFQATVNIKAKAHFLYNAIQGMRDISGFSPANDPITFQPGVQYLGPFSLNEEVDANNLNEAKLAHLAGMADTVLV